jgi:hypothetical protein
MITAMIDNGDGEWRLETIDEETLDTGKRDTLTFNIDDIDFFGTEEAPCKSE